MQNENRNCNPVYLFSMNLFRSALNFNEFRNWSMVLDTRGKKTEHLLLLIAPIVVTMRKFPEGIWRDAKKKNIKNVIQIRKILLISSFLRRPPALFEANCCEM